MLAKILVAIVAADVACGMVASNLVVPNAALESGPAAAMTTSSVNRALKGDRLPRMELRNAAQSTNDPQSDAPRPRRIPPGCDPAFSPIADPAFATVFGRCAA